MSIHSKNKVASIIAATFLLASASSFAADELVEYFPDGDMETGITGFDGGNSAYTNGPIPDPILAWNLILHPKKGTEYRKRAYNSQSGWCRFINDGIKTANQGKPAASEHAPAPNTTTVAYCNHKRKSENDGIGRQVNNIQLGGEYTLAGDGATLGSLRWAYSYNKVGAPVVDGVPELTSVSLTNVVVSDGTWQSVTDSFVAPEDVDLSQPFHVFIQTPGSEMYPTNAGNIADNERARLWVDNISLIGPPMPDMDGDGVNDFVDSFPNNPAAAADTDGDGMPDDFLVSCEQACVNSSGLMLDDDDDNDTVVDIFDAYPLDAAKSISVDVGPGFSMFIENTLVTLDASKSVPNNVVGTYIWFQLSGTEVTLAPNGQTVSFTAPSVEAREEAEFELSIEGAIDTQSATYPLSIVPMPATVTATATIAGVDETTLVPGTIDLANGTTLVTETNEAGEEIEVEYINVVAGDVIVISGSATTDSENIEDNEFTYLWEQFTSSMADPRWDQRFVAEGGITDSEFTFTVPEWNEDTPMIFQLTVDNGVNWPETEKRFDSSVNTVTVKVNLVKTQSPEHDTESFGSLGFMAMLLLSGLTVVRRLFKK